jgi:phosphohistidine phosphatase
MRRGLRKVRTLYLFRHAKASQPAGGANDHARPLTDEGAAAASRMGAHLKGLGVDLGQVLCSTSRRTVETYENAARSYPGLEASLDERVYDANAKQLLGLVRALDDGASNATVVGHNPGMAELAMALAGAGDLKQLAAMAAGFSPGSVARIDFDAERWSDIGPGDGTLALFVTPKDLGAGA